MLTEAIYDKIGKTYDETRTADPEIVLKIIEHLSPNKDGYYLDIGCGSGNYTHAIFEKDFHVCGVDISKEMLVKAGQKNNQIEWVHGDARTLPFSNQKFDGATCILATHHIKDIENSFEEVFRVLKKGRFLIFTSFPEQMEAWWLNRYFPKMMSNSSAAMHNYERVFSALHSAGFEDIQTEKFFVDNDLKDCFLQVGKQRPHMYLDPRVRAGISSFALVENQEEIILGCEELRKDIASGEIKKIIELHESKLGDYVFIYGIKK